MTHDLEEAETAGRSEIDRRTFLKLAAFSGGVAFVGALPASAQATGADKIEFVDPKYRNFYNEKDGYFLRDQGWVDETLRRIVWPKDNEKVPEFTVLTQTSTPDWGDAFRKWGADAEKLGIKYNVVNVSQARYLEAILSHRHGDVEIHNAVPRIERLDPSEWIVSRAYGLDRRNYGEWANSAYDEAVEAQGRSPDRDERRKHIMRAQEVLADDLYITQFALGPEHPAGLQQRGVGRRPAGDRVRHRRFQHLPDLSQCPAQDQSQARHRRHHGRRPVDQHHQRRQSLPRHRPHDLRPASVPRRQSQRRSVGRGEVEAGRPDGPGTSPCAPAWSSTTASRSPCTT